MAVRALAVEAAILGSELTILGLFVADEFLYICESLFRELSFSRKTHQIQFSQTLSLSLINSYTRSFSSTKYATAN